jgi:hypothetical protein
VSDIIHGLIGGAIVTIIIVAVICLVDRLISR